MKLIIAGSRTIEDYSLIEKALAAHSLSVCEITQVVSGQAPGVDRLGEKFAGDHDIPFQLFPALWGIEGCSAGFRRNERMAAYADALLAIWDGHSRGTAHMITTMKNLNKPIYIFKLP